MKKMNDLLGQILEKGPSQGTLFLILNKIKGEGRSSEVIQGCLRALAIYPDDTRLRRLLAEAYLETGFTGRAEAELDRVASDIRKLATVYKLQAKTYIRQKRTEEASEALRLYLVHQPTDQEAIDLLSDIEGLAAEALPGLPDTAAIEGDRSPRPGPGTPEACEPASGQEEHFSISGLATPTLAEIYYNQGQIQEALITYEKVLSRDPDDQDSRVRLSEIRALITGDRSSQAINNEKKLNARKERLIEILEGWLPRIRDLNHA